MLNLSLKNIFYLFFVALTMLQASCKHEYIKKGKYFYKVSAKPEFRHLASTTYYKLDRIDTVRASYYSYLDSTKIKMIEELLSFEGDTTLCAKPIQSYFIPPFSRDAILSSTVRSTVLPSDPTYQIQVEALLLINQLYFEKPFDFAPRPALFYKQDLVDVLIPKYPNLEKMSQKERYKIIDELNEVALNNLNTKKGVYLAFQLYKKWFKEVKSIGIKQAKALDLKPLTDSIYWYHL
jgi:hypothetical protein